MLFQLEPEHKARIDKLVSEFGEELREHVECRYFHVMLLLDELPNSNGNLARDSYKRTREILRVHYPS